MCRTGLRACYAVQLMCVIGTGWRGWQVQHKQFGPSICLYVLICTQARPKLLSQARAASKEDEEGQKVSCRKCLAGLTCPPPPPPSPNHDDACEKFMMMMHPVHLVHPCCSRKMIHRRSIRFDFPEFLYTPTDRHAVQYGILFQVWFSSNQIEQMGTETGKEKKVIGWL